LSALSGLYARVTQVRRRWYQNHRQRQRHLRAPVISVGNLTVGGSGKTPVVAALAQMLQDDGFRPAILSRGYGRRAGADLVIVSDGVHVTATAEQSGDEPLMLARALPGVPVMVCADRYRAGLIAEERFGATVHLLDDGFQHVRLGRAVDLLLMSPSDLGETVLPSGRLREPLAAAAAADAVLVPGSYEQAARVGASIGVATAFQVVTQYLPAMLVTPRGEALPAAAATDCENCALAVAAIARPFRFFEALKAQGWNVRREVSFRDHHWFSAADVERVVTLAKETGAEVILTTEKDAVRLEPHLVEGSRPFWAYVPIRVTIEPAARFKAWLRSTLAEAVKRS
jgi:tetraacyldisaccharide 4'-kinase